MVRPQAESNREFSNVEVVTIAAYLLGAQTKIVHTEDVAIRAHEMAPGRFVWRRYPEHIDLQGVRFALENAKRPQCGYVTGTGNDGWLLTEIGYSFAEENIKRAEHADLAARRLSESEKKWLRSERKRILASVAFLTSQKHGLDAVTGLEAKKLFRIDPYVAQKSRERKITRLVNAFRDDSQLGPIVTALAQLARAENQHEQ